MEDQVRELTSQLQSKIGDSLRAVGVYSRDTNTVIYVRDVCEKRMALTTFRGLDGSSVS